MGQLLPVRDVGSIGVVTDIRPASLPINAFTRAKNVRFDEGSVGRSPVFRTIKDSLGFNPRFTYAIPADVSGSYAAVVLVSDTFALKQYTGNSVSSIQGSIATTSAVATSITGTSLADIAYINRRDQVPVYMANGGTSFAALPNWDSNWRAESVRAYGDFLLALNTTESGTNYPSRVRYSNLTLANSVPDSWDASDTTKSAGFNDLVQMKTGIVDGVINQNCVAEVEGTHYVLDHDDIYVHDSHTRQSICDERVKNYIFSGLNTAKTDRCFVHHNADLDEVMFCYVSGDDMAEYTHGDRCNRAAVYNYKNQTWSFVDLPNVASSTVGTISSTTTYANTTAVYNTIGGSYYTQEAGYDNHSLFVGESNAADGLTSDKLYGLDLSDSGSLSFPLDSEANKSPFLERSGIDLDEVSPLTGYKVISKIVPQVDTTSTDKVFQFSFGAADLLGDTAVYSGSVDFDVSTDYKIDSRVSGRYLSYKMTVSDNKDFDFLGFDLDMMTTGRR